MSTTDILAWTGAFLALLGIVVPLVYSVLAARARFNSSVRYRIEALSNVTNLAASQSFQFGPTVQAKDVPEPLRVALHQSLDESVRGFLQAVSEDAVRLEKRLKEVRRDSDGSDPFETWHLMIGTLEVSTRFEVSPGTLLQAQGISHLTLLLLGLSRDRDASLSLLRGIHRDAQNVPGGPSERVAAFAEGLLPHSILERIREPA